MICDSNINFMALTIWNIIIKVHFISFQSCDSQLSSLSRSFQPLAHWKAFGMMMKLPADAAASAAVVRRRVRREGEQQWARDGERRDALLGAAERCMCK